LLTLLPVVAKETFNLTATGYAYLMAASGAGAIVGALLYAGLPYGLRSPMLTLRVQVALGLLLAAFALSRNLILTHALVFLAGMCLITLFASVNSLVQLGTAEEMRGRTMSIFMLAFRGGMPLGSLALGALAAKTSPTTALLAAGIALGLTGLGFLAFKTSIKRL
jgi:predicted MFS family arabinose efflux permease